MTQAVIEIGSTGIRLLVAEPVEFKSQKKYNILDTSENPVNIGRDVFTRGAISRETLLCCIHILERYAEQLSGWGITPDETIVMGTSAVREANNRDPFVDRIKVQTGFTVNVIDGTEENRLMYLAVQHCVKKETNLSKQGNSIVLDISGGATEMMLMEKGRIVGAHSIRLGTVIIEQKLHSILGTIDDAYKIVEDYIRNARNTLSTEMNLSEVQQFIVLGADMKIAAVHAGKQKSDYLWEIRRDKFIQFVEETSRWTPEECMAKFKTSYIDSQTFQISLIAHKMFLEMTSVEKITVPDTSIREGVLLSSDTDILDDFTEQITASAMSLLRKYQGDTNHAECVRKIATEIYDALEGEMNLCEKSRTLLEVSAILHDIGMFIGATQHNEHGKYIVNNSEIFGLTKEDKRLASMIVSFHKGIKFPQDDPEVKLLPRSSRMTVLKLSAILRVADALDRNHKQEIRDFTLNFAKDSMTFRVKGHRNLTLEKIAVEEKSNLFENVFGYKVVLV